MYLKFLSLLKVINIFANVFNWVEIHTLSFEIDQLYDNIRRVELQLSYCNNVVEQLETQFEINLYAFSTEKDRLKLENIIKLD